MKSTNHKDHVYVSTDLDISFRVSMLPIGAERVRLFGL